MADATINITVTGGPDGDVDVHLAGGAFDRGHTEGAPTRLTVPYEVAKKLFIDGDQSAAMQAYISGQIKVEGDMTKVMALQTVTPTAEQQDFQAKLADPTNRGSFSSGRWHRRSRGGGHPAPWPATAAADQPPHGENRATRGRKRRHP